MSRRFQDVWKGIVFFIGIMLGYWLGSPTAPRTPRTEQVAVTHDQRTDALVCRAMTGVHFREWEAACAVAVGKKGGSLNDAIKSCYSTDVDKRCMNGLIPPDAEEQRQSAFTANYLRTLPETQHGR